MAKIISYNFLAGERNIGTEENPIIEQITTLAEFVCHTQEQFDANYPIAEAEAIPDTIEVSGEFDPESDIASTDDVLNALLGVTV